MCGWRKIALVAHFTRREAMRATGARRAQRGAAAHSRMHWICSWLLVVLLALPQLCTDAAPIRIALSRKEPLAPDELLDMTATADALQSHKSMRELAVVTGGKRVPLRNYGNVQYIGRVAFGNPLQHMDMVFDTGSSDTWIPGVECDSCGSHTRFQHTRSTTFLDTRTKFFDAVGSSLLCIKQVVWWTD